MIFVTVGSQMPFDRLIAGVEQWAERTQRAAEVFAQIGASQRVPKHIKWTREMGPDEFKQTCQRADFIVAHAGMGSILSAMELGKPIVVMPRLGRLMETRNDHQVATANWLKGRHGIDVAEDETHLPTVLDAMLAQSSRPERIAPVAAGQLTDRIRAFIQES